MIHKKIFETVLENLDAERAGYFSNVANKLEEDPRAQKAPNLIFLILKDTAPFLPTYLQPDELITELLAFVQMQNRELSRLIYSRKFIEDPSALREISSKFVARILEIILEKYDGGEVEEEKQSVHTVSWPYDNVDFPYVDDDD